MSREDQRRLGDILQRVYDDVVKQGVPDRFKNLLEELEEGTPRQPPQMGLSRSDEPAENAEDHDTAHDDSDSDRLSTEKGWANPGRNGSQ